MESVKILVVDDEADLNEMIRDYLEAMGYRVFSALNGKEALESFRLVSPDLIVLDLMMPGIDGIDVTRRIRSQSDVPIIMLTAKAEEGDKLLGLEIGADDYITKPFSLKELAARIRVILRRVGTSKKDRGEIQENIRLFDLEMNLDKHRVEKGGHPIDLTAVQFDILRIMMEAPGRVFSRIELLGSFQQDPWEGYERSIDVHIKNLRKLIEEDPSHPKLVETVWGVGYRFREERP